MPQFKLYIGSALHSVSLGFRSFVYTIIQDLKEDFRILNWEETQEEGELPLRHDLSAVREADLVLAFVECESTNLVMILQAARESRGMWQDILACTPKFHSFPDLVVECSRCDTYKYRGKEDILVRVEEWRQRQQHPEIYEGESLIHFFRRLYIANPEEFQSWKEHLESASAEDRDTATYGAALKEVEDRFEEA